jgi:aryl-alcohol dehydrogenase-like predicted oxidoreductase
LGLGSWIIGGDRWEWGWGPQDEKESILTVHKALDCGINWIVTAACYGLCYAEEVIGKAIKDRRQNVIVATKCVSWLEQYKWGNI